MSERLKVEPCPFCDSTDIHFSVCDDDSFTKTIIASCCGCWTSMRSNIDYKPYSSAQPGWYENREDFEYRYKDAWRTKIITKWNKRIYR
jgi:hypothetical protein